MGEGPGGRYVFVRNLNSGAYGTVYEAQDTVKNERVAIKKADLFSDGNDPNDQGTPVVVLREGSVVQRLQHPNVVRMLEMYLHEGHYNFVFELCDCNMREHMAGLDAEGRKWMDEQQLNSYIVQILSGVGYCHERRIIHRDLKPDNMLLDTSRQSVKIADFGMARVILCKEGGKYTDRLVTHWYRPPEIILGDTQYNTAVDMWSLGCVFLEMMLLCPIFATNTEWECLMLIFQRIGTPDEVDWPGISNLPNYLMEFPQWQKPTHFFRTFQMEEESPYFAQEEAADLIRSLLALDPRRRITCADCLHTHPFLVGDEESEDNAESDQEGP